MRLKALIVDDEPIARGVLRDELEEVGSVEIVGEAENGAIALDLIRTRHPDVVFLDLQMPVMSGFEVVRHLGDGSHLPSVVIVTAYDQYAIEAFEAGAIDYLLKPVGQERLAQAVDRVRRTISRKPEVAESLARLQEIADLPSESRTRKVVGRAGEEYFLLNVHEVYAFQAEGELVWIITANKKYLSTQTLRILQERLQTTTFRRIHRNALVNMDHVRKMTHLSSQRWLVTLSNSMEFIVSKRQAKTIRQLLS
jgi:two-component system, LytTR family, response regulator